MDNYLFRHGDRVRSVKWYCNGTIYVVRDSEFDSDFDSNCDIAEVRWDNSFVHDELDLVRDHLIHLD